MQYKVVTAFDMVDHTRKIVKFNCNDTKFISAAGQQDYFQMAQFGKITNIIFFLVPSNHIYLCNYTMHLSIRFPPPPFFHLPLHIYLLLYEAITEIMVI